MLAVCLLGLALVLPQIRQRELDRRVKAFMLEVQAGLQKYHVAEEQYPAKAMTGRELIALLVKGGFLSDDLENPWTQSPLWEVDWLKYRTDDLAEVYELITFLPGTDEVHYRLDSIENHSLEEN